MIGGKVHSSKRMSPKRRSKSPKRKSSSSKRKSPRTSAWFRKLTAWRKANRHADGSLPSMKSAMKHCKGRSSRRTKCRKNQGRKASSKSRSKSPKRKSPKRKSASKKSKSPKRKSSKRKSPKRKSSKRKSPKRKSAKRKSPKRKSSKKRSYTRKPKALPGLMSAKRDELSRFRRYGPRMQQAANALATTNAPFYGPARKYQPQQQLSPLFGQSLPQGLQNFQQNQEQQQMIFIQTPEARRARLAAEQQKRPATGILGLLGL